MLTTWLALVAILPVLYMPGLGGFEAPKSAYLLVATIVVLGFWLFNRQNKLALARPGTVLANLTLGVYLTIRARFVAAPNLSWLGSEISHFGAWQWLTYIVLFALMSSLVLRPEHKRLTRLAGVIALIGMLGVVFAQVTGLEGISWQLFDDPARGRTLIGSIGSSGQLGVVLAVLLFTVWPLTKQLRTRPLIWQICWYILLTLTITTIILTKSLTGIILLIVGGLLLALQRYLKPKITLGILAFGLVLPLLAAAIPLPSSVSQRVPSWQARTEIWREGIKGFAQHPIFGYGPEQFFVITDNNLAEEHPHSLLIEILTEWGLVGLVIFGWLIWQITKESEVDTSGQVGLIVVTLAAQTNVLIIPLTLLLLVNYLLVTNPTKAVTISMKPGYKWLGWALFIPFSIYTGLIATGSVVFSYTNDQGSQASSEFHFSQAVKQYEIAQNWPLARTFSSLEYAEAMTNDNLYYQIFTNQAEVRSALQKVEAGAPTKRNLNIVSHIKVVWQARTGQEL